MIFFLQNNTLVVSRAQINTLLLNVMWGSIDVSPL